NNPNGPLVQQLRSPESIAALHNVNQTLFHSVCAFTFDQDEGFCAFDRLNYPDTFGFISNILGGLGTLGGIVIDGVETIRTSPNSLHDLSVTPSFIDVQFEKINPKGSASPVAQVLGFVLQPEQAALLGCGPAYANPCSKNQAIAWQQDPAINGSVHPQQLGGVDLMNADASVVTQEFSAIKALEPGALVGTRMNPTTGQLEYLPGINYSRNGSFRLQQDPLAPFNPPEIIETGAYLNLTPDQVLKMGREGRARYQIDPNNPREADGWVEPMPWQVDKEAKKKFGAIVFDNDPNNPLDPN